jgi:3'-phosphoadenosine 5'-phosphosulfate sulfotransferase (PAPS reductase)/FAD synthetase
MPPNAVLFDYVIKASYGNDSCALIQWCFEQELKNVAVLYNDTGWAHPDWNNRVARLEDWVLTLGFEPHRTKSIGLEQLVRNKKGWPRQGIQFCTAELKIKPTQLFMACVDPDKLSVLVIGVRREESSKRAAFPEFQPAAEEGRDIWAPLVTYTECQRDALLFRAGIVPLPTRSKECWPCINSNRADLQDLTEVRVDEIESIEISLGTTSKGKTRTMFRPYRYMGATGIREIVRWANSARGEFDPDDGGGAGCEAGWCGL